MTDPNDVRRQFEAWFSAECPMTAELANDGDTRAVANRNFAFKGYQAALQSPAVRELVEAKRKYEHLCAAFNDMKTSTSERFLECLGIEDDVCKPLDEILNTALRTLGAGHVE